MAAVWAESAALAAIEASSESDRRIRISILPILLTIYVKLIVLGMSSVFKTGISDSFAALGDRLGTPVFKPVFSFTFLVITIALFANLAASSIFY